MGQMTVTVVVEGADRPRVGAPVRVEVRDVTLQDAAARTLAHASATVSAGAGPVATVELPVPVGGPGEQHAVWAHVDVDGDGRVSTGDYITVQSYEAPASGAGRMEVAVRRV